MFPIINWNLISLELLITAILVVLIVVDILLPKDTREDWLGIISFVGLTGLMAFWSTQRNLVGQTFSGSVDSAGGGMFIMDSLAWFFKGFFLLTMVFVLPVKRYYLTNY